MTKQNTRRTQVLTELSGLRTGGTTSPTTSTLEFLGPVQLSTAKRDVINYIAALPVIKGADHILQFLQYLTDHPVGGESKAEDTQSVDKAVVDGLVELYTSMRANDKNRGTLTKGQTIVRELILAVMSNAAEDYENGDVTSAKIKRRLGITNLMSRAALQFNEKAEERAEMFALLKAETTEAIDHLLKRKVQKDKRDITVCSEWWHNVGSRVDTNAR